MLSQTELEDKQRSFSIPMNVDARFGEKRIQLIKEYSLRQVLEIFAERDLITYFQPFSVCQSIPGLNSAKLPQKETTGLHSQNYDTTDNRTMSETSIFHIFFGKSRTVEFAPPPERRDSILRVKDKYQNSLALLCDICCPTTRRQQGH